MASLPPPPPPPPLPDNLSFAVSPPVSSPPDAAPVVTSAPQPAVSTTAQVPTNTLEAGTKSWETPWNPTIVKEHAKDWSLAGDTALLLYLREMSEDMISKTSRLGKDIDQLAASIKTCEVSTNNAFNEFITLANSQFVENRVYDEDVEQPAGAGDDKSAANLDKKEKSKEEVEAELIPKISEAVRLGLNVLDTAYERLEVDIEDVDSDDEDPYQGEPMMEVKDPYVLRSLPVLIGCEEFHQTDNVGLIDAPSDDATSDHGSISESEDEADDNQPLAAAKADSTEESEYSHSSSDEAEEPKSSAASSRRPLPVAKNAGSSAESGSDDGDDLFGTSAKPSKPAPESPDSSEGEPEAAAVPGAPVNFAAELAKKIGSSAVAPPDEADKQASRSKKSESKSSSSAPAASKKTKKSKKKKTAMNDDLFGAPDSDEDDGLFNSRGGLFDSGGGLFDTKGSQDDGGLFDDVADMDVGLLRGGGKAQSSSDEDESEEDAPQPVKAPAKTKQAPAKKPAAPSKDLFGSDSDEDDDMFAQISKAKPQPTAAASAEPSDESDGLSKPQADASRPRTASGRKVPAGAVSMFGSSAGGNPLAAALSKRRKSSSAEEEGSDWDTGKSKENIISKVSEPPTKSTSGGGLFSSTDSDEEGSDLFGEPKATKAPSPEHKKKLPAGAVSMFGGNANPLAAALKKRAVSKASTDDAWSEDEESSDKLSEAAQPPPSSTKPPTAPSGLFDEDEDNDDDLFGSSTKMPSQPLPAATTQTQRKKPAGDVSLFGGADPFGESLKAKAPASSSLFDEDDNGDIFSTKTALVKPAPIKQAPAKQAPVKQAPAKSEPSKGLFSDSDDDDLFSAAAKATSVSKSPAQVPVKPPATAAGHKGLFSDSDNNDEFTSVSAQQAPVKPAPVKQAPVKHAPGKQAPAKTAPVKPAPVKQALARETPKKGFLSDSDDDDMFGSSTKVSTSKPDPAKPEPTKPQPSKGMFSDSDDDDLFSGKSAAPKINSGRNSSTAKKGVGTPSQIEDDPLLTDTKPEIRSKPQPVAGGGGLFSSGSDDDLFGSKPATKPAFETTNQDEDASKSGDPSEEEKVVEAPKPRRPAGAVSMFGGMDPSALLKKKVGGHSTDPPSQSATSKPGSRRSAPATKSVFDSDSSDNDGFFAVKPSRKAPMRKKEWKPVSAPVSKQVTPPPTLASADPLQSLSGAAPSSLEKSSATSTPPVKKLPASHLGINPLAMMPGSIPPRKEPTVQAVDFNVPAENSNVLHSMNKSRARIQQKRKPPSRHLRGRESVTARSTATVSSVPPSQERRSPSEHIPVIDNSADTFETKPGNRDLFAESAEEDGNDIFITAKKTAFTASKSNNDDLFGDKPVTTADPLGDGSGITPHSSTVTKKKDPFADDSDDDFFSTAKSKLPEKKAVKSTTHNPSSDTPDFANGTRESPPDFANGMRESPPASSVEAPPLDNEPPHLSPLDRESPLPLARESSSPLAKESPPPLGRESPLAKESPPLVDKESSAPLARESPPPLDRESLPAFSRQSLPPLDRESPPPLDDSPPAVKSGAKSSGFTLDDSDDDIFSSKITKKSKQKPSTDIFDDDLFGDSKPAKKKSVLDDINDDDLFSIKPKSVSKRAPRAVTKDEDLFGDDDIFADIPVKVKEKKPRAASKVKKTSSSSSSAKASAFFDDDMDDLFADLGTKKKATKAKKIDLDDDDLFGDLN